MRRALSFLLLGACGLDVAGTAPTPDPVRPAPTATTEEVPPPPPVAVADDASVPALELTREEITGGVDLTAEGSIDWIHWGASTPNRKGSAASAIADYTTAPAWARELDDKTWIEFRWSDGEPSRSDEGTTTYSYLNGADGLTATIAVRAGNSPRVARFYVGGKDSRVRFEARLAGATSPGPIDVEREGSFLVRIVARFTAPSNVSLELVSTLVSRRRSDGSVRIAAATLSER